MDFIECIKNAGVIGAGGAGFPAHVKLNSKAEYLILNCAECEPLLRVDQQIIIKFANEIIQTLKRIMQFVEAKKVYIGIKAKHKEEIQLLNKKLLNNSQIEIVQLGDFYPAGDEQVLVYEITKRIVPEAGIPLKVGCIVTNVETVLNIYNSFLEKSVTHTYLTIGGKVPKTLTLKLPIGVSYREILEFIGISNLTELVIIDGGPIMGKIVKNIDSPITKTTKGIILLEKDHYLIRKKTMDTKKALKQSKAACLQCRMCTDLCPRHLLGHNIQPHLMMRKSNYNPEGLYGAETALICSECSICELYACPVGLSPRLINIHYKNKLSQNGIKYTANKKEFYPLKSREYRKIPAKRLIQRVGIKEYDLPAPLEELDFKPKKVMIPLKQHIGAVCIPVVDVGQNVKLGELIGDIPENSMGAKIHSSIDGIVKEVSDYITIESI